MLLWLRLEKSIAANLYFRMSELKVFQLNQGLCFQKRPLILLPRLLRTLRTCRWKKLSWFWNFWVCRKSWAVLFFSLPGNALLSMRTVNFQLCSKTIYQISKFIDAVTITHKSKKTSSTTNKKTFEEKSVQTFFSHRKPALHPAQPYPLMFTISLWSKRFKP